MIKTNWKSVNVYDLFNSIVITICAAFFIAGCGENSTGSNNLLNVTGQHKGSENNNTLTIDSARWETRNQRLRISGTAPSGSVITIKNATTGVVLGSTQTNRRHSDSGDSDNSGRDSEDGDNGNGNSRNSAAWNIIIEDLATVPCRVQAVIQQSTAEKDVDNAPEDCDQGTPPPPANQPPNGSILEPAQNVTINVGDSVTFSGEASDPDNDTLLTYVWDFGGGANNSTELNPGAVSFTTAGNFTVTFTVTDSQNLSDPTPDSRLITVTDPNNPLPNTSHAGRFDTYEGSSTCLGCHASEVNEVHASVHYQWNGPTPYVVNLSSGGKLHSINDFCGYPDINFIGQLTNLSGDTVDGGCATCHIGMGAKPDPVASQTQLENIDCLTCHSDSYRRKVVRLDDNSFRFEVAPERMTVPVLEAITDIHRTPSKGACVNCHSYAGGGCNNKRGDMEEEHRNPASAAFDVHMAPTSVGGAGLVCVDCHTTQNHRIAGRGVDIKPTDLDQAVRCTNCHSSQPHNDSDINQHTVKVDCTVCHIQQFAKIASTDMIRDYSKPAILDSERQLYDPNIERQANVAPEIRFWNGTSTFYEFGTQAVPGLSGRVLIAGPAGDINDSSAKLFAFKHHLAVLPHDPVTGRILPMKLGILLQTGNVDGAITAGVAEVGWSLGQGYDFIDAERYMGIFHEVSPASEALGCNDCHNGGSRVDFTALGYDPRPERDPDIAANCASGCHSDESGEWSAGAFFTGVHNRHVDREGLNCSRCHNFSR